jgi:hypothetical protein
MLHSFQNYLTPEDFLLGRIDAKLQAREAKFKNAKKVRPMKDLLLKCGESLQIYF